MKLLKILAFLVIIGGCIYWLCLQDRRKEEKASQRKRTMQIEISQFIARNGANSSWESELLKQEENRLGRVLTIDIQKYWISDQPIYFLGGITDLSSINSSSYNLRIYKNNLYSADFNFTNLELDLVAPREMIDAFLSKHPNFSKENSFISQIAVVAKINKIITRNLQDGDIVTIGQGEAIDLLWVGDALSGAK